MNASLELDHSESIQTLHDDPSVWHNIICRVHALMPLVVKCSLLPCWLNTLSLTILSCAPHYVVDHVMNIKYTCLPLCTAVKLYQEWHLTQYDCGERWAATACSDLLYLCASSRLLCPNHVYLNGCMYCRLVLWQEYQCYVPLFTTLHSASSLTSLFSPPIVCMDCWVSSWL